MRYTAYLASFVFLILAGSFDLIADENGIQKKLDFKAYHELMIGEWTGKGDVSHGFVDKKDKIFFQSFFQKLKKEKNKSKLKDLIEEMFKRVENKPFANLLMSSDISHHAVKKKGKGYTIKVTKVVTLPNGNKLSRKHDSFITLKKLKGGRIGIHSHTEKVPPQYGTPLTENTLLVEVPKQSLIGIFKVIDKNNIAIVFQAKAPSGNSTLMTIYGVATYKRK